MKPLICTRCGGTISRHNYICEYCGTQYELDEMQKPVIVFPSSSDVLAASFLLNKEVVDELGKEEAFNYAKHILSGRLANAFENYVDYDLEFRPDLNCTIVKAKVRVLKPSFKFGG